HIWNPRSPHTTDISISLCPFTTCAFSKFTHRPHSWTCFGQLSYVIKYRPDWLLSSQRSPSSRREAEPISKAETAFSTLLPQEHRSQSGVPAKMPHESERGNRADVPSPYVEAE
ncbi:hypothetical protein HispidOSU_026845, partial [Sigmodon hispidus]